jgi:xanthine/uracil/vitamin C permease (AzgA family)
VRGKMISLVPKSIMLATAGGIGLFLAFIGMQNSNGIGLITYNSATLVTLGERGSCDALRQRVLCAACLMMLSQHDNNAWYGRLCCG